MKFFSSLFDKVLSALHVRALIGGLEVSDQILRLVYYNGRTWQLSAVRLAPGVMEKGKIKDATAFATALVDLRAKTEFAKKKKKKMNVVVSLSSVNMYSQVFTLPPLEGKGLNDAVDLNVKMLSPVDIKDTYYGWEVIGTDVATLRAEVSSAFVDRGLIDGLTQALYAAGFITVGVESRALALVRIFRQKGTGADVNQSYVLVDVDNSGIDFLVMRKGRLYFEYPTQWADLMDSKGEISVGRFKDKLAGDLRQVMNFYSQHWPEPVAAVILAATAFEDEAETAIRSSTQLPVIRMSLVMDQQMSLEWMVALGCSLRGTSGALRDKEINLSGEGAIDTFRREQFMNFLTLWRVIVPVVLGCLLVVVALADNFLIATKMGINAEPPLNIEASHQMVALQASSTAFNQEVSLIANAESQIGHNYQMIGDVQKAATEDGITVTHLSFQGQGTPIIVAGDAPGEPQIVAFKAAMGADPHFSAVQLPLTNIQQAGNTFSFSMTFSLAAPY